ncbi:MAG: gamma-glutamyltransferase family protein [Bryobacterales bacterium]
MYFPLRLTLVAAFCCAAVLAGTRPLVMGRNGVVVSGHHLASEAGLDMLKKGGNAVDAGVATVFAQAVTEFDRFGLGGEVPILIYLADQKKVVAINGHGPAPLRASLEWFREHNIDAVAGDCFLPAVVPAAVDSLIVALDEYGTLSLGEVLAPAIAIAENGFGAYDGFIEHIQDASPRFEQEWPTSAKVFLPGGKIPAVGDVFVQKDLARTLRRLVEAEQARKGEGRKVGLQAARDRFYRGDITREIVDFQKKTECRDQTGAVSTGLLELEDFARYQAVVEEPEKTTYRGIEVYKVGFWSQGPVLLQALNLLEGFDVKGLGHNSAAYIHLLSEAMKLAYADREWYYADPTFVGVPEQGLLSKAYAAERRKLINMEVPSLELRPGDPYPFNGASGAHAAIPKTVEMGPDRPGTTGTRVADKYGNVFSATPSGGWFPTSPILEGLGFVLGTRGQAFFLDPDKANRLEPGKKPRTTLTPSLALKDGQPFLAWGTPGGDVQDQVNLQVLLNMVEFGMDLQEAVEAPIFQILDFPPSFYPRRTMPGTTTYETRISPAEIDKLEAMGHSMRPVGAPGSGRCDGGGSGSRTRDALRSSRPKAE